MILDLTFKCPDAAEDEVLYEAAEREVIRRHGLEVERLAEIAGEEDDELMDEYNEVFHELSALVKKWIMYGEYVTVRFDTELGTCTVVRP